MVIHSESVPSESIEQNLAELKRMRLVADRWGFEGEIYAGTTCDLDMRQAWYCPLCLSEEPLSLVVPSESALVRLGGGLSSLRCESMARLSNGDRCRYVFHSKASRIASGTIWWRVGFKYPLSQVDLACARDEELTYRHSLS